jgi:hypothetical protein
MILEPTASIPGRRWILSRAMQEWLDQCHPRRLLTSPGIYAMLAGLIAFGAVGSPRAAPDWFFLLCLSFAGLGIMLAFWTVADLSITLRRYRAETISFEVAAQGMARAARAMFRAAQMGAIALAIGVGALLALAFPGLAILAAMLSPVFAIAIAALPGAVVVPRLADAALALVVPVSALSPGADGEERFLMGWRFASRMGAVRASLANRSSSLPSEARDFVKALDGGGMIRPPFTRLPVASGGALRLRTRGLKGVVAPALPVALFVWLVATLMPPGALSVLPRPGDLWQLPPSSDAAPPDPASTEDHSEEDGTSGPGPDDAAADGSAGGGESGGSDGAAAGGAGRDGAGGSAAVAGSDSEGEGPSDGAEDGGQTGDGQSPGDGGPASGQNGETADAGSGGAGSDGAGQDGASQTGGDAESVSEDVGDGSGAGSNGAQESSAGQDGASQADEDGGSTSDGGGSGSGDTSDGGDGQDGGSQAVGDADQTAAQGPDAPRGGDSVSSAPPSGSDGGADGSGTGAPSGRDGASEQLSAETPPGDVETQPDRPDTPVSAEDVGRVRVPGTGDGAERGPVASSAAAAEDSDILSVGTPPSLFAEPGAAPQAVLRDLSPETASGLPPGPAIPPSQRLPAWIADLLQ